MMLRAATFVAALILALNAAAQTRITRPIHLIVPYVQGGGTDVLSRLLAPYIAEEFGQQVLVENRAGGGSTIGTQQVARAAPDGHTIGMIDAAFVTNPSLMPKLPYDTTKDFVPVVFVATSPLVLIIHPAVPVTSVAELVALAKAKPGQLTYGSAGNGTGVHLAAEQLRAANRLVMTHVPYKGSGQALTELAGGQTTMLFATPSGAKPLVAAGRLRALAITGAKRSATMPDTPTFAEAGFPAVDAVTINGIVAPAGTPSDYVARLNATVQRALATPALSAKLAELGFDVRGGSADAFAEWLKAEVPKWARIIEDAGVKVE